MTWPKVQASTTARGYGTEHQKLRAKLLPLAYGTPCSRCGQPMLQGQTLHFDHTDDRTNYLGFSHAACNLKAGAQKAARLSRQGVVRLRRDDSYRW